MTLEARVEQLEEAVGRMAQVVAKQQEQLEALAGLPDEASPLEASHGQFYRRIREKGATA